MLPDTQPAANTLCEGSWDAVRINLKAQERGLNR